MSTKSEPWTEEELKDFREIMEGIKSKNNLKVCKPEVVRKNLKMKV